MKQHVLSGWKAILVVVVVLVVLGSAGQVFGTEPDSQDVTLSATVRKAGGGISTFDFTFALEEAPAASAVLPNYSTIAPEPSTIPEPSTLVLVGLGGLGLALVRRALIED